MAERTEIVKAEMADGTKVYIQATVLGGEEEVGFTIPSFQGVTDAIGSIASSVYEAMQKVRPHRASVEFGLEIALEAGQLTALVVKGTGSTNLKVTLEWSN